MIKRLLPVFFLLLVFACDSKRVFEADHDFQEQSWSMDVMPEFDFEVSDTGPKDLILKLRSTLEFPYQNCYLTFFLQDSLENTIATELVNIALFDDKTGKPLGKGNSVYQYAEVILDAFNFPTEGNYKLKVAQYMREADLGGVLSVGLRIEEAGRN